MTRLYLAPAILLLAAAGAQPSRPQISAAMFRHHFITTNIPQRASGGDNFGTPVLADFDKDGDLDFAVSVRLDKLYWFENTGAGNWTRHEVGQVPVGQLGAAGIDADGDGWTDIVMGGYWYRNTGRARQQPFQRSRYDPSITAEVHDIVAADVNGDGKQELVMLSDEHGCFWYRIPSQPGGDAAWPRTPITDAVRNNRDDIHGGIAPAGVADLDGDGDSDLALTNRWLENRAAGAEWIEHPLPFGKRGPWGLSSRSWIADINRDGHKDIVVTDSDQTDSRAGWLESDGKKVPTFKLHLFPRAAPGTRGSFHSLVVSDFDGDGDLDVLTAEQEDSSILPSGAPPRWYIWENLDGRGHDFAERVIFDGKLGGHDVIAADIDGDGDLDFASKIWALWTGNANGGRFHADWFENLRLPKR